MTRKPSKLNKLFSFGKNWTLFSVPRKQIYVLENSDGQFSWTEGWREHIKMKNKTSCMIFFLPVLATTEYEISFQDQI